MPDFTPYLDLGATALVAIFAFYFMWQANKYKGGNGTAKETLNQVKLMNENHLNSICSAITKGNQDVVQAINNMDKSLGTKLENLGDKIDNTNAGIARLLGRSDLK